MQRFRVITFLLITVLAAALSGCGDDSAETLKITDPQEQEQPGHQRARGNMAKIVSLNGDQLTVILAEMAGGGNEGPEGENRPEAASAPAIDGPNSPGQRPAGDIGEIEFTGEEATHALSGTVTIMRGMGDNAAEIDLSELAAGDIIRFTTVTGDDETEVIDTIVVME